MNVHDQDDQDRDDVEDLDQEDRVDLVSVPVEVQGPVRVRELPRRRWVSRSMTIDPGVTLQLGGRDLTRAVMRVWIVSWAGGGVCPVTYIGESDSVAWASGLGIMPPVAGSVIDLTHCDEVWARNSDTVNAVTITVVTETWAE